MKLSESSRKKLEQAAENAMSFSSSNLASAYGGDSATLSYRNLRKAAAQLSSAAQSTNKDGLLKSIDDFEAALQATATISSASAGTLAMKTNSPIVGDGETNSILAALDSVREELGGGRELEASDKQQATTTVADEKPKTTKLSYLIAAAALFLLIVGAWLMLIKDKM